MPAALDTGRLDRPVDGERAAGRAEVSKKSGKRLKTGNVKYSNTARGEGNKDPKDKDEWDNRFIRRHV